MEQSRRTAIAAIIIVVLMVLSTLGFVLEFAQPGTSTTQAYNSYTFKQTPQGWSVTIEETERVLLLHPTQLEDITIRTEAGDILTNAQQLLVTFDPTLELPEAYAEAQLLLEQELAYANIFVLRGLVNATGTVLPEVSCANATQTTPVLLLTNGTETSIRAENNCILAEAVTPTDAIRAAERIVYKTIKVMP